MKNNKIILDLCGGTGAWSKPYRDAGYDVRVITLPHYDIILMKFLTDGIILFYNPNGNRNPEDNINIKNV